MLSGSGVLSSIFSSVSSGFCFSGVKVEAELAEQICGDARASKSDHAPFQCQENAPVEPRRVSGVGLQTVVR